MRQASIRNARAFSLVAAGLALAPVVSGIPHAHAQEDSASKGLKAISDDVVSQKTISVTSDSDVEVISATLQKSQPYTLRIKEWKTDSPADAFAFEPEQAARKLALGEPGDIDEAPHGVANTGARK